MNQAERRFAQLWKWRWALPFPRTGCALRARDHPIRRTSAGQCYFPPRV